MSELKITGSGWALLRCGGKLRVMLHADCDSPYKVFPEDDNISMIWNDQGRASSIGSTAMDIVEYRQDVTLDDAICLLMDALNVDDMYDHNSWRREAQNMIDDYRSQS